jgi:hypothetical protein
MPIHDWTRVRPNRFHDFHQSWTIAIRNALNAGQLPPGYFAMVEQRRGGPEPDVMTAATPSAPSPARPFNSSRRGCICSSWICSLRGRATRR